MNVNPIFRLIKFFKEKDELHAKNLIEKGQIYFNLPSQYNDSKSEQYGDSNEGAEWIDNSQITNVKVESPTLGTFDLKPSPDYPSKLVQYNDYYLIYSIYQITYSNIETESSFQIDKRMLEWKFGVVIEKPYDFLRSIITEIKNQKIKYEARAVSYIDLSNNRIDHLTPFDKKSEHQHQNEFRIILENTDNLTKSIEIGSIKMYAKLVTTESILKPWRFEQSI